MSPFSSRPVLMYSAALLILSGIIHTVVWLIDGTSLAGPVSWRKPILFGFSAGVTLLSMAWLTEKLPRRRGDSLLFPLFGLAVVLEVLLISLQTWRGVPSHFNRATPLDASILVGIESLILFVTLVIVDLTWRSFGPMEVLSPRTEADMTLAIRGGMLLLLFSCLMGFVLVAYGNARLSSGMRPDVYGAAGVMKFPHGVPMHAIQYLPILAWALRKASAPVESRTRVIATALASLTLFTGYSVLQTFQGRARFDLSLSSGCVLAASVATAIAVLCGSLLAILRHQKPVRPISRELVDS